MIDEGGGFRGYISSRPVRTTHFPQRIQNVIVRSYAERHDLPFRLSMTEYVMPGCFMMLYKILDELPKLDGVVLFSMFMLPARRAERERVYEIILDGGKQLHAALEDVVVRTRADVLLFEDTLQVARALTRAPLRGRFTKAGDSILLADPFCAALLRCF